MGVLIGEANVSVAALGDGAYLLQKSGGGSGWNGSAVSAMAAAGDFTLRLRPMQGNRNLSAGVSAEPQGVAGAAIGYGFYFRSTGLLQQFEGGSAADSSQPAYAPEETFWLIREAGMIRWLSGAELESAALLGESGPVEGPLWFDSAFFTVGSAVEAQFLAAVGQAAAPRPAMLGGSFGLSLCL